MNIWTIKEGEPLPIDGGLQGRIMRMGIITSMLAERGHNVTWFASNYSHQQKIRLRNTECIVEILPNLRIHLLHSKTIYKKNISLARINYFRELANEFLKVVKTKSPPDIIYVCLPSIDFAYVATKYAKENNIPIVVDVRDLWPDIFINPFPKILQPVIKLACWKYEKMARYAIQNATAVTVITPSWLETWVKNKGRNMNELDHTMFLAYNKVELNEVELKQGNNFLEKYKIKQEDMNFCFFGNMGKATVDFSPVLRAFELLNNLKVKMFFCGTGTELTSFKKQAAHLPNIIFPGYLSQVEIQTLMKTCIAGIIPYKNSFDFVDSVPNKVIEYMSSGLPVISSLQGFLKEMLDKTNSGLTYGDSKELAEQIIYLTKNTAERNKMSGNALELFNSKFDGKKVYSAFCDFLENNSK